MKFISESGSLLFFFNIFHYYPPVSNVCLKHSSVSFIFIKLPNTLSQGTLTLKALTSPFLGFVINPKLKVRRGALNLKRF